MVVAVGLLVVPVLILVLVVVVVVVLAAVVIVVVVVEVIGCAPCYQQVLDEPFWFKNCVSRQVDKTI